MTLAQDHINQYYSPSQRSAVKELDLTNKSLEGKLSLESFTNLEKLDCSNNNLAKLTLNSSQLRYLDCSHNNLTDLDLTCIDSSELTYLRISNNNLTKRDLSSFSRFINLEVLIIGSGVGKKFNNFVGSLQPLQTLSSLTTLNISNTNIVEGLEHLPASLTSLYCYNDKKSSCLGILTIYDALKVHDFQISKWRKANIPNYVDAQEKIAKLELELEEYRKVLSIIVEEKIIKVEERGEVKIEEQNEQENKEYSAKIEILPK